PRIKKGHVTVGTSVNPILVTELEPETQYYAYLVTKGAGQVYSDVYLYTFRTEAVVRPVITLDLSNPTVTITADRQSNVDYLLINYDANMDSRLTKQFKDVADYDKNPPQEYLTDFTVLEAMNTDVTNNNRSTGSVFDLYATQKAQEDMANYIRATTPNGTSIIGKGSTAINAGQSISASSAFKIWLVPKTRLHRTLS
ncbi:MAG: hypothetical protein OSJ64_03525, partial [Firmicutes bacterium]|nr:hypothetical protein [Bacillota bacterium]